MPRVIAYHGSVRQREYCFSGSPIIAIGRALTNDIILHDPSHKVSGYHAALIPVSSDGRRYFVRDLGSLNATRVGGDMVDQRALRDGDVIEIGDYRLVFSIAADSAGATSLLNVIQRKGIAAPDMPTQPCRSVEPIEHMVTADRSELLDHLDRKTGSGADLRVLLDEAAPLVLEVMRARRGFVRLFRDEHAGLTEDVGVTGMGKGDAIDIADIHFMSRLLGGTCVRDGTTLLAPVLSKNRTVGFFCLDRHPASRPFIDEDGDFLIAVGRRATALTAGVLDTVSASKRETIAWPEQIIGKSREVQTLLTDIREAASGDTNVLLIGETGSGKELAASAIRQLHPRNANGPFIKRHCAQTTESVAEIELFGYAPKSGLAGANPAGAPGWFEMANGGTLFLDEIQSLSPTMQEKLLRVLQEKEIWRYGGRHPTQVDVKVIAATSVVDLEMAIEQGRFQKSLYYRFRRVRLPTLRGRREDIPLLVFYFLDRHAAALGAAPRSISRRALQMLSNHTWPGNVRELEDQVLKAVTRNREVVFSSDLDVLSAESPSSALSPAGDEPSRFHEGTAEPQREAMTMREVERKMILETLQTTHGNITRAGKLLGYRSRMTMLNKMDQFGIPRQYGDPARQTDP